MRRPIVIRSGRLSRVRASINLDCLKWAEWDKVKPWRDDLEVILHLLKHPESYMFEVTLYCAPQVTTFVHLYNCMCVCVCVCVCTMYACMYLFFQSFIHSFINLFIHSFIHLFIYLFIYLVTKAMVCIVLSVGWCI